MYLFVYLYIYLYLGLINQFIYIYGQVLDFWYSTYVTKRVICLLYTFSALWSFAAFKGEFSVEINIS